MNHRWAATGPSPASLQTVERLQGARLVPQLGHTASVTSAAYSPDGQHIVTASWDGTVPLWDAGSSSWLLTRMSFRDGSWAVVEPEGRFDAANDGDVDGLAWVLDGEPYALCPSFATATTTPASWPRSWARRTSRCATSRPSRHQAARPRAPPRANAVGGGSRSSCKTRGGGIGRLFLRLNGNDISDAAYTACPDLEGGTRCTMDQAGRQGEPRCRCPLYGGVHHEGRTDGWSAESAAIPP